MDDLEESDLVTSEGAGGAPIACWKAGLGQRGPPWVRHNLRCAVSYLEREGHLGHGLGFAQDGIDYRPGFQFLILSEAEKSGDCAEGFMVR